MPSRAEAIIKTLERQNEMLLSENKRFWIALRGIIHVLETSGNSGFVLELAKEAIEKKKCV